MVERRIGPLDSMREDLAAARSAAACVESVGWRSLIDLRLRPDRATSAAVRDALGCSLPITPDTWTASGEQACMWLGPDEWLLLVADGRTGERETALRAALGDDPWISIVDVSHAYTGLTLTGPEARDILARGCRWDLHPRGFRPGQCARTSLARARLILRCTNDDAFELWVASSFARYTAAWLMEAIRHHAPLPAAP
jgi:sarcosine oxidase, subunit gamma